MNIHPVFSNKWFWIGLVALGIFSIIFEVVVGSVVLVSSLTSGKWDHNLLMLGIMYSFVTAYKIFADLSMKRSLKIMGRITFLISAIWAYQLYGFFSMIYFLATIFILAKVLGWVVKMFAGKSTPYYQ